MLDHYIQKGNKRLRCGYTTGSCAAAAAKAAALMLLTGRKISKTSLMTPAGIMLNIEIADCSMSAERVSCTVIKDGGDDPDVTDGASICAEVSIAAGGDCAEVGETGPAPEQAKAGAAPAYCGAGPAGEVGHGPAFKAGGSEMHPDGEGTERSGKDPGGEGTERSGKEPGGEGAERSGEDPGGEGTERSGEDPGGEGTERSGEDPGGEGTDRYRKNLGGDWCGSGRTRVIITGGRGVGRVTKKGLDQPVGEYAINSTPRRMITENVMSVMDECGFQGTLMVRISVPGGEEIAARTFNPRLGIVGGISIIGTTGIVEPMSDLGLLGTVRTELNMLRAGGCSSAVITIGNYSQTFVAEKLPLLKGSAVTCSNFIGDTIDMCIEMGFSRALVVGHLGKMVKLGAGIMNTHSSCADGRMEVMVSCGLLAGADTGTLKRILSCATTDAALEELEKAGVLKMSMQILADRIQSHLDRKSGGLMETGAVFFSNRQNLVVMTERARQFVGAAGGLQQGWTGRGTG